MNELACAVEGCKEVFKTVESLSANARFICRYHTTKQVQDVFFQDGQWDPEFSSRAAVLLDEKNAPHGEIDYSKGRIEPYGVEQD